MRAGSICNQSKLQMDYQAIDSGRDSLSPQPYRPIVALRPRSLRCGRGDGGGGDSEGGGGGCLGGGGSGGGRGDGGGGLTKIARFQIGSESQ
ncbi:hypothetical protein V1478_009646 [Vespula squamosa]|uniref:Uncharacterized protein n=1 Tax=Vespula squamosa TaxID=30214 RepID=A0ABD2AQ93_VESSQ